MSTRGHSRLCSLNLNELGNTIKTTRYSFSRSRASLTTFIHNLKEPSSWEKFSLCPVIKRKSCPLSSQSERVYYGSHIIIHHNQLLSTKENDQIWKDFVILNQWHQNDVKSAACCRLLNCWLRKPGDKVVIFGEQKNKERNGNSLNE